MRRLLPVLVILLILSLAGGVDWWLYNKYFPQPIAQNDAQSQQSFGQVMRMQFDEVSNHLPHNKHK